MLDHLYLPVTDLARSKAFYTPVLEALEWRVIGDHHADTEGVPDLYGFYAPNLSSIWLHVTDSVDTPLYLGISAPDRARVDAVYALALSAGGTHAGPPSIRHYFSDGYYAANVLDPDGHTVELVNKGRNRHTAPDDPH